MQYDVVTAADLDTLNEVVSKQLKSGWKLKNSIIEHLNGFTQELVRSPMECVYNSQQQKQRIRRRWIDID